MYRLPAGLFLAAAVVLALLGYQLIALILAVIALVAFVV